MDATPSHSSAEAYLAWFQQHKAPQYRVYLCSRYGLTSLDADAMLNEQLNRTKGQIVSWDYGGR